MTDGAVVSLWRYPVKSMMGEELNASDVTDHGLLGDRSLALVDTETGKVVSAKNPRKWPTMFDFRAVFTTPPVLGSPLPPVRVTLPDGVSVTSDDARFAELLTGALGRSVTLASAAPSEPSLEEYWPDIAELAHRETVTEEAMPSTTFFDLATIHVLTTATINRLRELYPQGQFEVRRFRPHAPFSHRAYCLARPVSQGTPTTPPLAAPKVGRGVTVDTHRRSAVRRPCRGEPPSGVSSPQDEQSRSGPNAARCLAPQTASSSARG